MIYKSLYTNNLYVGYRGHNLIGVRTPDLIFSTEKIASILVSIYKVTTEFCMYSE